MKVRQGDSPWLPAEVRDESLAGIGLLLNGETDAAVGDIVQIDYCGVLRGAEIKFIHTESGRQRLGLRWQESFD